MQFAAAGRQKERHTHRTDIETKSREKTHERVFSFAMIRVWGFCGPRKQT